MANIQNELKNIKNAIFGKDVRDSIYNGIEKINIEIENNTGKQNELEENLRDLTNLPIGVQVGKRTGITIDIPNEKVVINSDGHFILSNNNNYAITSNQEIDFLTSSNTMLLMLELNTLTYDLKTISQFKNSSTNGWVLVGAIRKNSTLEGDYYVFCFGHYKLNTVDEENKNINIKKINIYGDENKKYKNNLSKIDYSSLDPQDLYNIYDELCKDTDLVTKKTLGIDKDGNSIYGYIFKQNTDNEKVKILIVAGIHGHERRIIYSCAQFFTDLVKNATSKNELEVILANTEIIVIPILNVSGYKLDQRKNSNGVDLNRNFTIGWESGDTDASSLYYRGISPLSEKEAQLIDSLTTNEKFDIVFDLHNSGSYTWIGSNIPTQKDILNSLSRSLSFDLVNDGVGEEKREILVRDTADGGVVKFIESKNIKCAILEGAESLKSDSEYSQRHSSTALGNLILAYLRNFNNL